MEGDIVDSIGMPVREQLPKHIRPLHYELALTPDLSHFTFQGKETIDIVILEATHRIVLHAVDLLIDQAEVMRDWTTHSSKPTDIVYDERRETVTLLFSSSLVPGSAKLRIRFRGILNDQMHGFYRSTYGGKEHVMAVTQFEPADARRAFPCWDEPAIKAKFSLTLNIPSGYEAISNMPEVSFWTPGNTVKFKTSPMMSTYLLAMAVGRFESIATTTKEGVVVRVIAPEGKQVNKRGRFALEVATKILELYNDYFDIPYPLPKLDLLAVPDFAAGAMENWGLVTYRETAIFFDPDESSAAAKQRVALTIAHELAHQWFGNLITMEWWMDLWLNEGFASWIAYLALDRLFPEWNMWTQFVATEMAEALRLDGLANSHSVEVPVATPAQISETFDAISYSKGASIIRMLHAYLGEEMFQKGLRAYLSNFQYGNATTDDLWAAFSKASGKPIKEMMDCWTKQAGYPVVSIYQDQIPAEYNDRERFVCFQSRCVENCAGDRTRWHIPLALRSSDMPSVKHITFPQNTNQYTLELPKLSSEGWLLLNASQKGFYRTHYRDGLFEKLIPAVKSQALTPEERFGLQNDTFALARLGFMPTTKVLEILEAYRNENEYAVWADLATNIGALKTLWAWEPYYERFCAFARDLFKPIAKRMGWKVFPDDDHQTRLLRALALGALGGYGDELTIDLARYYYYCDAFLKNPHALHPDLRALVFFLVVKHGGAETYEIILNIYRKANLHEEKMRCLRALGASQDHGLLARTLAFSLSSEVRSQDTINAIASLAANRHGRALAWQFLRENWTEFDRRYGKGTLLLQYTIAACTEYFASEEKAQEIEAFFNDHPVPAARRTIQQSLEIIRSNAKWLARDRDEVMLWFEKRYAPKIPVNLQS